MGYFYEENSVSDQNAAKRNECEKLKGLRRNMNNILIDLPMSSTVTDPLNFAGEQDVVKMLQDVVRTVDEAIESNEDRLAVIKEVYARLKETRSRTVKWSNGDPQYCSALTRGSFIDLTMIELFGLCDHIPVGPDGLLKDVLHEAREPWFHGFDQWNRSTIQDALEMLCEARESIRMQQENTVKN